MSFTSKNSKEVTSSGFGSNINSEDERLVSKNGDVRVVKKGLTFGQRYNSFHRLINMPSLPFIGYLLSTYIVINLFFTALYLLIGVEGIGGTSGTNNFYDAFSFSYQTLTTVGYGAFYPKGGFISLVAGFEAFIGWLSFAVSTGLLYGRFSKPKSQMLMSENALITPYKDITGLMVRVANSKSNPLINASSKFLYSQIEIKNGNKVRKFYHLDLEIDFIHLFATTWTIVHPITDKSPLYNLTRAGLKAKNAEIILLLSAHDESYDNDVHSRTSYKPNDIIYDAKFVSIISHNESHHTTVHLDQLNDHISI